MMTGRVIPAITATGTTRTIPAAEIMETVIPAITATGTTRTIPAAEIMETEIPAITARKRITN